MPDTLTRPAHRWVPKYRATNGDLAAQVGALVGLTPDSDQRAILDAMFAEQAPGVPACFETAVVAPRQNIKTSTLQIAALTDLFVLEVELHIWTAHLFRTSRSSFEGMVGLIESNPDFRRRCRPHRTANGAEAIELKSGERIEFHARSKGGGRGLTGKRVTLDEGMFLAPAEMGALLPTLATMADAQVRHASSAGLLTSDVLRSIRNRGRKGSDPSLAYFEWCAPFVGCAQQFCAHVVETPGCALDRRDLWAMANPAFGRRISEEMLVNFRRAMPPHEFAREFLGWWDDPPEQGGAAIPAEDWADCLDPGSRYAGGGIALGVHVTGDRTTAFVGAVGRRSDGLAHAELYDPMHPMRVVSFLKEKSQQHRCAVVLDPGSHAGSMLSDLEAAGVTVEPVTLQKLTQACGMVIDAVSNKSLRHIGQAPLDAAVRAAGVRTTARESWAWEGQGITPLTAITLAMYGYATVPNYNVAESVW